MFTISATKIILVKRIGKQTMTVLGSHPPVAWFLLIERKIVFGHLLKSKFSEWHRDSIDYLPVSKLSPGKDIKKDKIMDLSFDQTKQKTLTFSLTMRFKAFWHWC